MKGKEIINQERLFWRKDNLLELVGEKTAYNFKYDV